MSPPPNPQQKTQGSQSPPPEDADDNQIGESAEGSTQGQAQGQTNPEATTDPSEQSTGKYHGMESNPIGPLSESSKTKMG